MIGRDATAQHGNSRGGGADGGGECPGAELDFGPCEDRERHDIRAGRKRSTVDRLRLIGQPLSLGKTSLVQERCTEVLQRIRDARMVVAAVLAPVAREHLAEDSFCIGIVPGAHEQHAQVITDLQGIGVIRAHAALEDAERSLEESGGFSSLVPRSQGFRQVMEGGCGLRVIATFLAFGSNECLSGRGLGLVQAFHFPIVIRQLTEGDVEIAPAVTEHLHSLLEQGHCLGEGPGLPVAHCEVAEGPAQPGRIEGVPGALQR